MPDAHAASQRRARRRPGGGRADLRRGATSRSCRRATTVSAPASAAARRQRARSLVVAEAVEEVLGVVDDALARPAQERDGVGDEREVLVAPDADDLLQVQPPGLADERAHGREARRQRAQPRVLLRGEVAPARHAEGGDLGLLEPLGGQELEELEVLGVRAREAGLDEVDAQGVQAPGDAHLLGGRERHALPLHAVAQGGVVELDRAHVPCEARGRDARLERAAPGPATRGSAPCGRAARPRTACWIAARDLAGDARADRVVVDLADRDELGGGAAEEDLVGEVELGAREVALDDLDPEVARDLQDGLAGDAVEDRGRLRRRGDHAVLDDVDVLARPLAHVAVVVEEDRLVVAGLVALDLGQDRVEVLAARPWRAG